MNKDFSQAICDTLFDVGDNKVREHCFVKLYSLEF